MTVVRKCTLLQKSARLLWQESRLLQGKEKLLPTYAKLVFLYCICFLFWCNERAGSMREQLLVFTGYCQEIIDRCSSAWCLNPSSLWLMDDKSQSDFHSSSLRSALLPHSLTVRALSYVYSCSHACTSQILPYIFSAHSVLTSSQMSI